MSKVDLEKLRSDLEHFFGTMYVKGHPMAVIYMMDVKHLNEKRLVSIAKEVGFNMKDYYVH